MTTRPNLPPSTYPGQRLGLPESGPQSIGRVGRRILAIIVDWATALILTLLVTGRSYLDVASSSAGQIYTLGFFVVLQILGIWAIGGSIGQRLTGLYLVSLAEERMRWWRPIVRSMLLALVIPALVWDSDQRGFHDKIAKTVLLRSR